MCVEPRGQHWVSFCLAFHLNLGARVSHLLARLTGQQPSGTLLCPPPHLPLSSRLTPQCPVLFIGFLMWAMKTQTPVPTFAHQVSSCLSHLPPPPSSGDFIIILPLTSLKTLASVKHHLLLFDFVRFGI